MPLTLLRSQARKGYQAIRFYLVYVQKEDLDNNSKSEQLVLTTMTIIGFHLASNRTNRFDSILPA
jgi:hypothetical protein